jgi:hypothetical protein
MPIITDTLKAAVGEFYAETGRGKVPDPVLKASWAEWHIPVLPATWKMAVGRSSSQVSPGKV